MDEYTVTIRLNEVEKGAAWSWDKEAEYIRLLILEVLLQEYGSPIVESVILNQS